MPHDDDSDHELIARLWREAGAVQVDRAHAAIAFRRELFAPHAADR